LAAYPISGRTSRAQGALGKEEEEATHLPTYTCLFLRFLSYSGLLLENVLMAFLSS
jgi:hypothetical protein